MIKSNGTLKIPGQIRDRKRQKNNENSGIRVRIIIVLDYCALHCTVGEIALILIQISIIPKFSVCTFSRCLKMYLKFRNN